MVGGLGYNSANGRYCLLVSDLWEDTGFHCGECLEVMVDDKWVATRMEMSAEQMVSGRYTLLWKSGICAGEDMKKTEKAYR